MTVTFESSQAREPGTPMHPFLPDHATPRIFGHRGFVSAAAAARGIVENTREAFAAALAAGATHVESDCQLTRDGRVVLFHDDSLTRVLGDPRLCADVTYDELSALMVDRGGLMGLDEALEAFPGARFNIDIKSSDVAEPAGRILGRHADRVLITSFSDEHRLRALQSAAAVSAGVRPATSPGKRGIVRTLVAVTLRSRTLMARAFDGLDALQIPERQGAIRILTPRLITEAHRRGVEVHVWTVNDGARMRELVRMGVDGIVTDRTDVAVDALIG